MLHTVLASLALATAPIDNNLVSPSHQPAALDALLRTKDYKMLGETIQTANRPQDVQSDLDWLAQKMMSGETAWITMLYARSLWAAADRTPPALRNQLRQTAVMATLYARAAIQIDGARCGDRTAPVHRLEQLAGWNREVWTFLASLPEADRSTILKLVPLLEKRTAFRRDQQGDVDFLCRAGLEETSYNLQHGGSREVPAKPGQIGRQIELYGDGKYKPSERPQTEWKAEAERRRAELPAELAKQVAGLSALRAK